MRSHEDLPHAAAYRQPCLGDLFAGHCFNSWESLYAGEFADSVDELPICDLTSVCQGCLIKPVSIIVHRTGPGLQDDVGKRGCSLRHNFVDQLAPSLIDLEPGLVVRIRPGERLATAFGSITCGQF